MQYNSGQQILKAMTGAKKGNMHYAIPANKFGKQQYIIKNNIIRRNITIRTSKAASPKRCHQQLHHQKRHPQKQLHRKPHLNKISQFICLIKCGSK